ncbi:hypothetical protein [Pseudomonas syringae group genomosp. 3]|uniref:Uncharacterized protein n=1 Tax=Pseudomonas syringae pv. coriandricola TaxID=264453 RepID=A0A0P9R583_9PSED|nr:hypothetical protein [Pseudomonas syringae group genomosp. 3]KPW78619.1 Uncharacterized protein ALO76_01150 [Pseudomonas syringae pv. coriandricola]RMN13624.1 hypothetical protein ALQ65_01610 [Pseudomonas syringae pv. coriandricola]
MKISGSDTFNDELIGFVITCLFCEAISKEEFNDWCAQALVLDKAPAYLYDLMGFHDEIFKVYEVIGYVPCWEHSEIEEYALYGIAVRRGFEPYDMPLRPSEALARLDASPDIEDTFREVFAFIDL